MIPVDKNQEMSEEDKKMYEEMKKARLARQKRDREARAKRLQLIKGK